MFRSDFTFPIGKNYSPGAAPNTCDDSGNVAEVKVENAILMGVVVALFMYAIYVVVRILRCNSYTQHQKAIRICIACILFPFSTIVIHMLLPRQKQSERREQ